MARVLVIDDELKLRQAVRHMLETASHEVQEAENGRAGLQALQAHRPQIVITDIVMPQKEGLETIMEIRRIAPEVAIIAISGGGRTGNLDFLNLARKFGACATLAKPFRMADLLKAVDDALNTRTSMGTGP